MRAHLQTRLGKSTVLRLAISWPLVSFIALATSSISSSLCCCRSTISWVAGCTAWNWFLANRHSAALQLVAVPAVR